MGVKINLTEEQVKEIVFLYTDKELSMLKIEELTSLKSGVIKRILKENNISVRSMNFYKPKSFDENFFEIIDTEEKAYWLGFIYADGCVSGKVFSLKISAKDIEHLKKFKNAIKSEHKICEFVNNNGFGIGNEACSIAINNKKLLKDLLNCGVKQRKTKELSFKVSMPNELIRHFIRGFFDGDGSIYSTSAKKYPDYKSGTISFTGTKEMLEWVRDILMTVTKLDVSVYKYKDKDVYDLKMGGIGTLRNLYEYFYSDTTIFLERKKNKIEEILNSHNKLDKQSKV